MLYTFENTVMLGKPVRVFVDGVEAKNAIEADTQEGYAIVYKTTMDGGMYLIKTKEDDGTISEEIATQRIDGKVTVEFIEE